MFSFLISSDVGSGLFAPFFLWTSDFRLYQSVLLPRSAVLLIALFFLLDSTLDSFFCRAPHNYFPVPFCSAFYSPFISILSSFHVSWPFPYQPPETHIILCRISTFIYVRGGYLHNSENKFFEGPPSLFPPLGHEITCSAGPIGSVKKTLSILKVQFDH